VDKQVHAEPNYNLASNNLPLAIESGTIKCDYMRHDHQPSYMGLQIFMNKPYMAGWRSGLAFGSGLCHPRAGSNPAPATSRNFFGTIEVTTCVDAIVGTNQDAVNSGIPYGSLQPTVATCWQSDCLRKPLVFSSHSNTVHRKNSSLSASS
jgi:hypothetical protein